MAQRAAPRPLAPAAPRPGTAAASRAWLLRTTALLPVALASFGVHAQAPTGGQVVAGQAGIAQAGTQTTITQTTDRAAINWQGFNIGAGNTVQFQQPNAGSWTLNRVVGPDPSVIAGRITANGGVALVNQSGIVFTRGAQVDVGSLIATAPGITNENFMAGRMRFDQAARPGAQVRNDGRITVMDRGIAVLAGPRVTNTGEIRARLGRVVLAGAEAFTLDLAGDGLISIDITQAVRGGGAEVVTNEGLIEANSGSVLLTASAAGDLVEGLVRNTGTIRANTEAGQIGQVALRGTGGGVEVAGRIEATGGSNQLGGRIAVQSNHSVRIATGANLDASGGTGGGTVLVGTTGVGRNQTMARSTTVERGAIIRADATVLGQGGTIAINSTEATLVEGTLTARGGSQGGNGGFVEISGQGVLTINQAPVDVTAANGAMGSILIDPLRIRITNAAAGGSDAVAPAAPVAGGTVSAVTTPDTGAVLVHTADIAAVTGNLILEATLGITVEAAVTKATGDLTLNTLAAVGTAGLTGIELGAAITLGTGSFAANTAGAFTIAASGVALSSGFVSTGGSVAAGGSATVTATGAASLAGGLSGGTSVTLTAGSISQTAGSIAANAGAGAVNLNSSGAIGQTGGGSILAGTLTVRGTAAGVTSAASLDLNRTTNALATLNALTSGALNVVGGGTTLAVAQAISSTSGAVSIIGNAGTSLDITGAVSGTAAVTLAGDGMAVGANITGQAISLTAASGAITQTAGAISAVSLTLQASGAITQSGGTIAAGALSALGATGGTPNAGSIALGQTGNSITGIAALQATGAIAVNAGAGAVSLATASSATSIALTATGTVTLTGAIAAPSVTITAGAITQSSGSLAATTGAASLTLQASGAITQGGGTIATGALSALGATGGTPNAGSIALGQTGNSITGINTLQASGAVAVNAGGGAVSLTTASSATSIALTATGTVTLTGAIAAPSITITAGAITQDGGSLTATAGAAIVTLNSNGAIQQTGTSSIAAGTVMVRGTAGAAFSAASLDLNRTTNAIGTLNALTTGALNVASDGTKLTIDRAISSGSGAVTVLANAGTDLVVDAVGGGVSGTANVTLRGDSIAVDAAVRGGTATIVALELRADGVLTGTGVVGAAGASTVRIGGDSGTSGLLIAGTGTVGRVSLSATTIGAVSAATLVLGVNAAGTTTAGNVTISTALVTSGSTALDIRGSGATSIGASVTATGVSLTSTGGTVAQTAGTIGGGSGGVTITGNGTVTLGGGITGQTIAITSVTANITQTGGSITASGGAASLTLAAAGTISQTGGTMTAGGLVAVGALGTGTAAGSIDLNGSGNALVAVNEARSRAALTIRTGSGTISIATVNAVGNVTLIGLGATTLTGAIAGANISVSATTSISQTGGSVNAGAGAGNLSLLSNGTITQSGTGTIATGGATGGLTIAGSSSTHSGIVTLNQSNNAITSITDVSSTGAMTINGGAGAMSVAVADAAGLLTLTTGTTATLTGAIAGSGVSISAASAIAQAGGSVGSGAGALTLRSNGTISQSGISRLTTTALTLGGITVGERAGVVILGRPTNAIDLITDARSTGAVTIHTGASNLAVTSADATGLLTLTTSGAASLAGTLSGNGITITASSITQTSGSIAGGAGIVTLESSGAVTQSGGIITGAALVVGGVSGVGSQSGTITLNQAGNTFASISARSTGNITIRSDAAALSVGLIAGDDIVLTAGSAGGAAILLNGSVTASGGNNSVTLRADGSIGQNAGAIISTDTLVIGGMTGLNAGSATLAEANVVGQLNARVTGGLTFTTTQAFSTNGNTVNAGALTLTASRITVASGDTLTVTTGDLILMGTAGSGTAISIAGTLTGVASQRVVLRADTITITGTGFITGNGLARVEVGPNTSGRAMNLVDDSPNVLRLDSGTMSALIAAQPTTLQLGETVIGGSEVRGGTLTLFGNIATGVHTTNLVLASNNNIALGGNSLIAGAMMLRADGAISGSGVLALSTGLTIRGADGNPASVSGQINLMATGNALTSLDAQSNGSVFVANRASNLIIRQARGTSVTIDADTRLATVDAAVSGGLGITATTGDAALRANSVALHNGITAGNGQTVTVQIAVSGTVTGGGVLSAVGGTVEIGPSSATAIAASGTSVAVGILNNAVASTVRFGRSTFNGGTLSSATTSIDGAIARAGGGTLEVFGGNITLNANISAGSISLVSTSDALTLANAIVVANTPTTGRVTLDAASDITQTGGGISAAEFAAIARAGSILLTTGSNAIGLIARGVTVGINANGFADTTRGLFATGNVSLAVTGALTINAGIEARTGAVSLLATGIDQQVRIYANTAANLTATGGGLALNGALIANTLTLSSGGAIGQNASGSIGPSSAVSTALIVQGALGLGSSAAGAVTLAQGNGIGSLTAAAAGALTIVSNISTGMVVAGARGTGVSLTATSLSLTGAVDAGAGTASVTATARGITQTNGGIITADTLTLSAAGTVTLDAGDAARATPTLWNQVGTLGAVTVTGAGSDFTFHATPAPTLTLNGAIGVADAVVIVSNGTLGQTAGSIAGTSVALAASGAVTLAGTISSGNGQTTITSATGAVTQSGGGITAGNFAAQGTTLDFALGSNALNGRLALNAMSGALNIDQAGSVTLGTITAATVTGTVELIGLSAAGTINVSAGALTSAGSAILAGGTLVMRTDALSLGTGVTISASSIRVGPRTAGQAMQIGSADTATTLGFDGTTLARLTAAGAPLTLGETLIGATSRVTAGNVTIDAVLTTSSDLTVIATGNISLLGAISSSTAFLSATGNIIQPVGVGGTYSGSTSLVTSVGVTARAGGGIDLRAPENSIGLLAAAASGGDVRISQTRALTVGIGDNSPIPGGGTGSITGVTAAGHVFLEGSSITVSSAVTAQAGGTLTLRADTLALSAVVTATGGTVVLETRTLGASPRPITLGGAEVGTTLSIAQAELSLITANTLVIGRFNGTEASAITVDSAGITLPSSVGSLRLIGASLTLGGNLIATDKGIEARIAGLTSSAGAIIGASSFTLRGLAGNASDGGSLSLGWPNLITTLDISSSGAVLLGLNANGGTISFTQLRGSSIDVSVANGGASVNGAAASTSGAFSLIAANSLTTTATITAADGLTLSGGTLTLGPAATATAGAASLTATSGALTLNGAVTSLAGSASFTGAAGTLVNAAVSVTGGGVSFSGAGFTSVAGGTITVAGGNLTLTNTGVVTIGGAISDSTGTVSITGGTTFTNSAGITGRAGVTLSAGTTTIGGAVTAATGSVALSSTAGALTLDAAVTNLAGGATFAGAGGTNVNAAVSVTGSAAGFSGANFNSATGGTITVASGGLALTNTGTVAIGSAILASTGAVSITGATTLGSTAAITGQTGVTLAAGTITIGGVVTAKTGTASLTSTGALTLNAGVTTLAGGASFASGAGATAVNAAVSVTSGSAGFTGAGFTSNGSGTITVAGGNLTIANIGAVTVGGAISDTTGSVAITGGTALTNTASIGGQTGLNLSAGSLLIGGALSVAGTGNASLTATASTITLNAGLTVASGSGTFASATATTVNGAVNITGGALGFTGVGFTSAAAGTLSVGGGNFTIANTGTVTVRGTVSNTTGSASVTGATTLTTTAGITGQTGVTLSADTVTIGGTVTATTGTAALTTTAGALTLNAGVTTLAGGATFASGTGGSFVNGPVSVTGGDATFTGGGLTSTAPGTITVAGGDLTIANSGTVAIGGALHTTTGSIGITGATILNVNATITAASGLTLAAGTLAINSAVILKNGALGFSTTVGDLAINASVTTLNGDATLSSAGATLVNAPISVTGGALAIRSVGFTSTAPGTLTVLTAHALTIANTGTVEISGAINDALGAVAITGATTLATTATITGGTGVTISAGGITLGAGVTASAGSVGIVGTAGDIASNAAVTATTGDVTLDARGAIVLNGAITSIAGGTITLNAGTTAGTAADRITQTAAGILGGTGGGTTNLVVAGRSLDASATLTQGNRLVTVDALTGGTLAVTSTGALSVARANSAGSGGATSSVSLTAASLSLAGTVNATTLGSVTLNTLAGSITQRVTGIITAATLSGSATGVVALATANNLVASTGAFTLGGDFSLLSTLGLTVASPLRTPGNAILLTANSLAIQGALTAGTVTLAATAGAISQANAGIITTPSLTATATAGVNLNAGDAAASQTTAWNQVTTLVSGTGGTGGFTLRNSRDLNVSGTVTAGTGQVLRLDATGTPVLGATSALSAPSGTIVIAASGPVELRGALTAGLTTITSATGPVTQTTGTITGRLAVRAIGAVDIQNPGNAITNLSANAVGGRVDVVSATAMTVVTATNVALHGGTTTTIAGVTGTTVFLTGPGLTLNAATTATTGDVQLRADTMAIAGGVNATAGEVRIEQLTLGATPRGISLGAEVAGSLSLTTSELAAINTPTLIIGRSTGVGAAAIAGQITLSGAISVPGSVTDTLRLLGSGIAINGSLNATGTAVTELRALTQSITSASGGVSGQTLIATSPFGSVTMSALNDFANVTGSSSVGGTFAYHDANGFQIIAPGITGAAVSLIAETGNITQAAGAPIVTGSLFALARNGSALLDGGGVDLNQIGSLAGGGAGVAGVFRLSNASGFTISGTLDNGAGGALGTAQLFTPNGSIIQTGGIIRANRLEITLPAGSASFGSGNAIATLGTTSIAGDLTLVNAGSLTLAGPVDVGTAAGGAASTTSLTLLSGSLTQGAGARLRADTLAISALGGDVLLTAGGSNSANDLAHVGTLAGVSAGGAVNLRFGTPIFVAGLLSAGSGAGALTLEAPGITIGAPGQGGTLIRGGSVVLRAQAGFDGPGGFPTGSIIQQGGAIEAINLAASAPGGNIMLDVAANRFTALAGGISADGGGSSQSLVAGGTIDVTEGGAGFTVQAGIASGGLTRLTAGNALTFNVATTLSGPIALTAGGLLTIPSGGQLNSGSTVSLSGGNGILVQGSVSGGIVNATTGGVFNLSGGSASAAMGAPGAINVTAGALQTSGGSFSAHTILLAANSGGADINGTTFNATGLVSVTATGNINVNGPVVNANAAQFRTSSFLALSGGNYTLGRVVVFAGAAGITTSSPTTVRPRNAGTFPGIVVDTRQSLVGFDPLTIVQADIVGVPVNDQPTQVRTPNADLPGAFGPSSNAPAGTAQIRLDALQSPVFLLLDGGSFSGVFNTSGRVGVHGRGGGSQASGVLVDPFGRRLEGQATASLADATRPATGGEIARFRVNDCVISSFNCVAPTQVIVIPVTVPSIPPLVFGVGGRDPDAVSPNVAEEWSVREDDE